MSFETRQLTNVQIAAALDDIAQSLGEAETSSRLIESSDDEWYKDSAQWHLNLAFQQLAVLIETLGLSELAIQRPPAEHGPQAHAHDI